MPTTNADITAKLNALREDYAARLPQELAALHELATGALADPGAQQAARLAQLHQRLHKLAGSAGSFGFIRLGKQAKQLEIQVQQWLGQDVDQGQLRSFSVAVGTLAALTQAEQPPAQVAVATPEKTATQTLIYLLEDDPAVAEDIALNLRHFGHRVEHFDRLEAAEAAILRVPPDFMVVDIVFDAEQRESPSLVAALQQTLAKPLPVVFISARDDFAAYHAAVKAGAIGYFVKPLDVIRLVDRLEHYLDRRRELPYRVLIVDDDATLAEHYRLVLTSAGMLVDLVTNPEDVLTALRNFNPEMILLDLNIPEYSGPELARVIRLSDEWLRVPITYLSSETDVDQRIKAMGQAGDDFIAKPISDRELISAVSIRAARSRQLSSAIDRDSLTGLLKHSRIKEQVDIELTRTRRSGEPLCVAMIDLDHFKSVNDTYGHPAGDKVIKALAHLLRQRLRKTDSIGRYGGEEFVAVLPGCDATEARGLLDDVRQNFKEINFSVDTKHFTVTLSAGLACTELSSTLTADTLLQMADDALYLAKHGGRDQICIAE